MKVGASDVSVIQDSADTAAVDSAATDHSQSSSVNFPVELSPDAWHQVSLGVYQRHVTLHVDCDVTMASPWRRRVANGNNADEGGQTVESSIVLSIGKAFIESSRYPRFEVSSQAIMTSSLYVNYQQQLSDLSESGLL